MLLLDEPLGALDLKLRKQMQLELKRIQQEVGITFLYVTHDQEEAMTMSDRLAVMRHGKIEQIGLPERCTRTPRPSSSPASWAPPTCWRASSRIVRAISRPSASPKAGPFGSPRHAERAGPHRQGRRPSGEDPAAR